MANQRVKYSDAELEEFKKIIQDKISAAEATLASIQENFMNNKGNGTNDTSPVFKAFEEGSETLSRESNSILAGRQEKYLIELKNALIRIENKTYGICRITGVKIPKERLTAVPTATTTVTAKQEEKQPKKQKQSK